MENTEYGYVPGDWWILAHPNGMAILDHTYPLATVQRLWAEVTKHSPLLSWISLLAGGELSKLGDFGLARHNNGVVELVLRGQVAAYVDGTVMDAQRKLTWREESMAAQNLSLVGASNAREALPTLGGVVFGDVVNWSKDSSKSAVLDTLDPEVIQRHIAEYNAGLSQDSELEDAPIQSGQSTSSAPSAASALNAANTLGFDDETAHGFSPAPGSESVEDTWMVAPGDLDGASSEFYQSDDASIQAAGSDELSLELPDGSKVHLDQATLIGRAPETPVGKEDEYQIVTVESPQHDVSRTHVEVKGDGALAVVTDQRSINGTIIIEPGQSPRRLHAGESVSVPVGTQIDIGDGIILAIAVR